ncbi:MAG: S-methyl-5'-thioinosine phosphorylase, partial [bacterium]
MGTTAIIGGSGLDTIDELKVTGRKVVRTPYGDPSGIVVTGSLFGQSYIFLPRHGANHTIPPHKVNYRANIWALKNCGVERIVAFAAVGGIDTGLDPGSIVIPDQLIDYTWGREHTFFDGESEVVHHIDFTYPYSEELRHMLIKAAGKSNVPIVQDGTYAATQGPRFETPAEIVKLERDGATIVGMTGMPEAALASELGIEYA